ncbi:hypothetical protein L1280_001438 [Deinococcus sp. HSC-46F16]|uniref:hypothetical protein n=1 Tax=Deinococcus sp. HSC-46F16 TaxID=2910968 RepID=UPI00209FCFCA|nr:hypothetical protein [Deinococcus sp. HSC-46F16]MCP2014301.1 hypothetical protein [Deinococcus sp. HSC-46F16]
MTAAPAAPRPRSFLLPFLLGWGLGALVLLLVRGVGFTLLDGPCQGRTVLALLPPLLLGPGGLALTAVNWGRPRRAALTLGLVVASLFPALAVGARDIGILRASGCAGGYVVVSQNDESVAELTVDAGTTLDLTARVGGYSAQTHPGPFTLSSQTTAPGVSATFGQAQAAAGETVPLRVTISPTTPANTYTLNVRGVQREGEQSFEATGTLTLNVRR